MAQFEKAGAVVDDHTEGTLNLNEPERISFPGMEIGTDISMELPGSSARIKSGLIGIEPDQFLILRLPPTNGIMHKCEPGSKVILRYLFNGAVIGFTSSIIQVFSNPISVCFLEFPKSAERINLRKDKRVKCFFPGIANYEGIELPGAILDLSASGCRFFIEESPLSKRAEIRRAKKLRLHTEAFGSLEGQIANVTTSPGILGLGIAFANVSPEFGKRVRDMQEMASKLQFFQI